MDAPEKLRGLDIVEPTGVICTHGDLRERRRAVNDAVLAADRPVHPCAAAYRRILAEEAPALTALPVLDPARVQAAMGRIGRRVVLGDPAAGDEQLAAWLRALREEGNWMGLRKGRTRAARRLYAHAAARIWSPPSSRPTTPTRTRPTGGAGSMTRSPR